MPAIRKEGLFFTGSPWESFPCQEVQSILLPLCKFAAQAEAPPNRHLILMAFPIIAYETVNDTAVGRDKTQFMLLYRSAPLLASRLLKVATEYLAIPSKDWDMRRALLELSSRFVWIKPPKRSRSTFRLRDFQELRSLIHERCPQHVAVNANLIRKQHYYKLHREMKALWMRWLPHINAALGISPADRTAWLQGAAPIVNAAGIR